MDQKQQQVPPPVGSVWERRNRDGTVERRHVRQPPPFSPKGLVAYSEGEGAMRVTYHTTLDTWLNWVGGHEPAQMVEPPPPPPPPVGSVWERHNKDGGVIERRRVIGPPHPNTPLDWVSFIRDNDILTESTPPDCWLRWAEDAKRVDETVQTRRVCETQRQIGLADRVRFELLKLPVTIHTRDLDAAVSAICSHLHVAQVNQSNFEAAVELNRELSRKLLAAEAERDMALATLNEQAKRLREVQCQLSSARSRADDAQCRLDGEKRLVDSLLEQIRLVDRAITKCQEAGPSAHSAPPGTNPAQERVRLIRYYHTEWQRLSGILGRVHTALASSQ